MENAPLSAVLDEVQWRDTFTYDDSAREMVPVIHPGDVIELQLVGARPRVLEWASADRGLRSVVPLPGTEGLHRVSGSIKDRKPMRTTKDPWTAMAIISAVPIVSYFSDLKEAESRTASWVSMEAILEAEISFAEGPVYAPLAAKVISVEPKAVVTDDFGNPHPGHYLLTFRLAPRAAIHHTFSRFDIR